MQRSIIIQKWTIRPWRIPRFTKPTKDVPNNYRAPRAAVTLTITLTLTTRRPQAPPPQSPRHCTFRHSAISGSSTSPSPSATKSKKSAKGSGLDVAQGPPANTSGGDPSDGSKGRDRSSACGGSTIGNCLKWHVARSTTSQHKLDGHLAHELGAASHRINTCCGVQVANAGHCARA